MKKNTQKREKSDHLPIVVFCCEIFKEGDEMGKVQEFMKQSE